MRLELGILALLLPLETAINDPVTTAKLQNMSLESPVGPKLWFN